MNSRKHIILSALAAVIIATLACSGLSTSPSTSNFYMASDKAGTNKTTTFSTSQDFFVFFDVSGIPDGTKFQAQWFALDVAGQDASKPFQTTDYTYGAGVSTIYFQLTNSSGWPTGHFRVDLYMSGTKIGEQAFSVQ
jgi:hypothetical protein